MRKLSTGEDNTLESWINLSTIFFGPDSEAVKFLKEKAANSKNGIKEEVVADERQLLMALATMDKNKRSNLS